MTTITQTTLFSWENVEKSSEISRLARVLDSLDDTPLLDALCRLRKGRRNDYPVHALWRSVVAGIVLGHATIAALIRELRRNAELREVCGWEPVLRERAVAPDYVFSRFLARLMAHENLVNAMFHELLDRVATQLPDLGRELALDSKALPVLGPRPTDADQGTKAYEDEQGEMKKVSHWFGYKLHLLVDAKYELPLAYEVTRASEADSPRLMPMVEALSEQHEALYERTATLAADKAYDDGEDKAALWEEHGIAPLIPARDCYTKTGGERMRPLNPSRSDTIYIGPTGEVCCKVAPFEIQESKAYATMEFMGFEKGRDTLKFRCPAAAWGLTCKNRAACRCAPTVREGKYGRVVRVALSRDHRLFTPIYAHGRRFAQGYKKRTSVERVNSRLDNVYGFERAFVRSRERMALRVGLALLVMLATASAWIDSGRSDNIRSLLSAA
jgi:hypothetical protein